MPKLSWDDLKELSKSKKELIKLREGTGTTKITVHMGTCGITAGARDLVKVLLKEIEQRDLEDIIVGITGCPGKCENEPIVSVEMEGTPAVFYGNLDEKKVTRILIEHILKNTIVKEYTIKTME